jgi:hypothetical protein
MSYASFLFAPFARRARESWPTCGFNLWLVAGTLSPTPVDSVELVDFDVISRPEPILGRVIVDGRAADGDDVLFSSIPEGRTVRALLITELRTNEGSPGAMGLETPAALVWQAHGMPLDTNGGDIIVTWDNGPNRIFSLPKASAAPLAVEDWVTDLLSTCGDQALGQAITAPLLLPERKGEVRA